MWIPRSPETYLQAWGLEPTGEPVVTPSSTLLPVTRGGHAAILKVARIEEEGYGCRLLAWWNGRGTARVWQADDHAALMERAQGRTLAESGLDDDERTRVLCGIIETLHGASGIVSPPPGLMPLRRWFQTLFERAEQSPRQHGGLWTRAARTAEQLLADESQAVALHGDLHHGNVLDFGGADWRAIDPKSIVGNRLFDYTSMLFNPHPAIAQARLPARVDIIAKASGTPPLRVLEWALASAALSAAWFAADDRVDDADRLLRIAVLAEIAAAHRG